MARLPGKSDTHTFFVLVLETGISSVIDRALSKNGRNFSILFQKEGVVYLQNYNPETFELKNSASILEVGSGS